MTDILYFYSKNLAEYENAKQATSSSESPSYYFATIFDPLLSFTPGKKINHLEMKQFILPLILSLFCLSQCKKEKAPLNITLYDKPLTTIQSYIQGKWKLHYIEGGICACTYQLDTANISLKLTSQKITSFKNNTINLDTTITWSFSNYASTYLMSWYDQRGYPYNRGANRIQNDTLVLYDPLALMTEPKIKHVRSFIPARIVGSKPGIHPRTCF